MRGLIERPAQRRRSPAGEFPDPAGLIRAVHADVDPGEPHRFARTGHARDVTELGQRDQGDQFPDSELGHQRLAAGLVASDLAQLALQLMDLRAEHVDHAQGDHGALFRIERQQEAGKEIPAAGA